MPWEEIGALLGMLAAVLGVLVLAWLFTRYLARRAPGLGGLLPGRSGKLRLLERMPLGREQFLAVVQAGEIYLLLGVTGSGVSLLRELSAEEAAAWDSEAQAASPPAGPEAPIPFRDALRDVLKQRKK
ncbi:MAG: flagellar biosynthetic protein FliO [Oscillibacter sp.]|uniref:FliO/MopB family protein n=1 Tax=Oscillibacter sp. TaxID=1945593 RepID=UPI00289D823B|nr:flagellar biosynthetic protein FliO [Oscillibacter sp.]MEA4992495.1 flagellar biosynthetic protein FliO [Oscillibacter sp.]